MVGVKDHNDCKIVSRKLFDRNTSEEKCLTIQNDSMNQPRRPIFEDYIRVSVCKEVI